jgi:hypothetical protein
MPKESHMKDRAITAWRKHLAWMVFLLFAAAGLQVTVTPVYPAARLVIEPMNFDCGVVDEGAPAVMQVRIENAGDQPVSIKNVQTN